MLMREGGKQAKQLQGGTTRSECGTRVWIGMTGQYERIFLLLKNQSLLADLISNLTITYYTKV